MKENPLWLYELKWRKAKKTYCAKHDIDSARTMEEELDRVGRFYANVGDEYAVLSANYHYEKHGFICFSKIDYFDAFSRLELKVLCRLSVEGKVIYAVLTEVFKFETVEITFFKNGWTGIKRDYL